eukprot:2864939-Amphidinium_carterae.1
MVTAYDHLTARLAEVTTHRSPQASSLLNVCGTNAEPVLQASQVAKVPVTMDDMLLHCRSVSRAARRAL